MKIIAFLWCLLFAAVAIAQTKNERSKVWVPDNGDGTYTSD